MKKARAFGPKRLSKKDLYFSRTYLVFFLVLTTEPPGLCNRGVQRALFMTTPYIANIADLIAGISQPLLSILRAEAIYQLAWIPAPTVLSVDLGLLSGAGALCTTCPGNLHIFPGPGETVMLGG